MADGVLQLQGVRVIDERLAATVYGHCYSKTNVTLIAVNKAGVETTFQIEADNNFEVFLPTKTEYKFYTEIDSVRKQIGEDEWALLSFGGYRLNIHIFATVFYTDANDEEQYVICANQADVNLLGSDNNVTQNSEITIDSKTFIRNDIIKVFVGRYIDSFPNRFLMHCRSLIHLYLPKDLPILSIGDLFLLGCYTYDEDIILLNVTSIGDNFLSSCLSFNSNVYFPKLTSIGNKFLYYCISYTGKQLTYKSFMNVTSIGDEFLSSCFNFNALLQLNNVTSIGDNFLYHCDKFNGSIDLSQLTQIPNNFMVGCNSFVDKQINLTSVISVGDYFMAYCKSFTGVTRLWNVQIIGDNFLKGCISIHDITDALQQSSLLTIGDSCLEECTSLNYSFQLGTNIKSIGSRFMALCENFNNNIIIPASVESIGSLFMWGCNSMISKIFCNTQAIPGEFSLNSNEYAISHLQGIKLTGTYKQAWKDALPDSSIRKLIVV